MVESLYPTPNLTHVSLRDGFAKLAHFLLHPVPEVGNTTVFRYSPGKI